MAVKVMFFYAHVVLTCGLCRQPISPSECWSKHLGVGAPAHNAPACVRARGEEVMPSEACSRWRQPVYKTDPLRDPAHDARPREGERE